MKYTKLVITLVAGVLVVGCGGGSSGGSPSTGTGGNIPTAAVKITSANAPVVAKGAMTPAQGAAKSSSAAGVVGVVVNATSHRRSIKDIALTEFARARNLKFSPSVVGVVTNQTPMNCATSGTMAFSLNDANNDGTMGAGDSVTVTFSNCNDGVSITNGSMAFAINNLSGAMGGAGTLAAPLTAGFTMTFNSYSTIDIATSATDSMNGDITFTTSDNGTVTTGTMSGTSLVMVSSVDGTYQMSNYSITFSDNISGAYSYAVTMTTADATMGGSVTLTTTTPFTGIGANDPTAGVMVITGASNSTLTLTALADGTTVTQVVDEDGAAGPIAPVALANTTWAAI